MGDVGKALFGGTDDSAQKAQTRANKKTQEFIEKSAIQGRSDVLSLFPGAEQSRRIGTQAAFDVLGQTVPQQLDVFQQGNVAAQGALLGGLDQFQNAILGNRPVDTTGFQPQALSFDSSFAQQQAPDFSTQLPELRPDLSPTAFNPVEDLRGLLTNLGVSEEDITKALSNIGQKIVTQDLSGII